MTAPTLGVIGTAGRDKTKVMTARLFNSMCHYLWQLINDYGEPVNLVSGGAAWADHTAVVVWLKLMEQEHPNVGKLTLHMPAPWDWDNKRYADSKCGGVSNHYFERMNWRTAEDHLGELELVQRLAGCECTYAPASAGMGSFFQRNSLVAQQSDFLLAFTWGESESQPADGGTLDTWNKCRGIKSHVPLHTLQA